MPKLLLVQLATDALLILLAVGLAIQGQSAPGQDAACRGMV